MIVATAQAEAIAGPLAGPASPLLAFAPILAQALEESGGLVAVLVATRPQLEALRIETASEAFCTLFGETLAALRGQRLLQLFAPEADPVALADMAQSLAGGAGARGELPLVALGQRRVWLGFRLMAAPSDDRQVVRFVLLGRDTTAQRAADYEQRGIQEFLIGAFQGAATPLAITDQHGVIQLANPELHRLLDAPPNGLVGRQTLDLLVPGDRERLERARAHYVELGKRYLVEGRLVRADGAVVPVTCTIVLAGAQQHTRFRIMTFQDRGLEKARAPAPAVMKLRIAGKIQLIGLEDVRAALGARWPALAERAMTTAEHILRRRLDPADTASRTDDCGFAVCFANGDEEAASFRAATIQREIRQRLIGEGSSDEAARVTAIVASLPPPPEGEIDPLAIGKVLEERRGALEQRAREALATALREGKCLPEPLLSRGRRTGLVWLALPAAIRRRIAVAAGILGRDQIQDHEIDRLTFDFALEYVADFGLQGEQGPDNAGGFLVPVGFETLCAKRQADAYVERLRRVDAGLRARLVLMLGVEDEQVTRTRLRDVALLLRPFGVRLGLDLRTLQVPPLDPPPQPFGIVAVPATTLFAAMDTASDGTTRLVARLHARGARLLGRQARGRDEVDALTTLGVDLTTLAPTDG